ncbi:phospholipase-like protein [Tanacetum coccineum]
MLSINAIKDINLDEKVGYTTNEESVMSEHEAINPIHAVNTQSFEEELSLEEDLDEWVNAEMEKHMSKQEEKNEEDALIAIIKSIREECATNNVMPRSIYEYLKLDNLEEATTSVEMDDMTQQETLGTMKNVLVKINKFEFLCDFPVIDMPGNLGEMVFYDDGSGEDCGMCPTCNPDLNFCYGYSEIFGKGEQGILRQWVAQNYEFNNKKTPLTTTVFDKCPYKTNYPMPITPDEWDTRLRPCDYSFDEWLKFKIGHTNIYDSDQEIVFNEWILDSFDVEYEYVKEIGNPYSQRFDKYKRVFDNEVENLSNEYTLRIGKKHDMGYEEEELWRSGDEKTDYEPPFVNVKTFEVKKYSFKRGQSFICITKQNDDDLPLGRVNGARLKAMIRKVLAARRQLSR